MKPGSKHIIAGMAMYFYYEDAGALVFEYFIDGKQYLYRTKAL